MTANSTFGTPVANPVADPTATAMRTELAALLNAVPSSRRVLQYLAVLEQTLKTHGLRGLTKLPETVLAKGRAQLMSLPLDQSHDALTQLLTLLTLSIQPPENACTRSANPCNAGPANQFLSSFQTEEELQVSEASHSDFQRVLDGQTSLRI